MKKNKLFSVLLVLIVSLCFIGCASTNVESAVGVESVADGAAIKAESNYELVGYSYKFTLDGNKIEYNFIDWYSDAEISEMAETLKSLIPDAVSAENTTYGEIVITYSRNLTQAEFDSFVESVKGILYNQFFA